MEAYKLTADNYGLTQGRVLCPFENEVILIATPTLPQGLFPAYTNFNNLVETGKATKINLEDENELKPHFHKKIKDYFKTH